MLKYKSSKLIAGIFMTLALATPGVISAQNIPAKINMSDAIQLLTKSGYSIEDLITLLGPLYQAIVTNTSNQRLMININANTGQIINVQSLPAVHIDWLQAAKILEQHHFTVTKLENKGDHYRADVYDAQHREADMEVDKVTGRVIRHVIS